MQDNPIGKPGRTVLFFFSEIGSPAVHTKIFFDKDVAIKKKVTLNRVRFFVIHRFYVPIHHKIGVLRYFLVF